MAINDTNSGPLLVCALVLVAIFLYSVISWRLSVRESNDLHLMADNARDGIVIQAIDGTILWCNQAFCDMTGYEKHECVGRSPLEFLLLEEERPSPQEIVQFRFRPEDPIFHHFETRENVRKDGSTYHVQIGHAFAEPSNLDRKYGRRVVATCRDVTDAIKRDKALMEAQFDMISMIQTDPLTGQFSRAYIHNWMEHRLAEKPAAPFVAMSVDIMNCQQISETLGHSVSDALIAHVGQTIRLAAPDDALIARSGDDAFLLVLPRELSPREALRIWNKVDLALAQPARVRGGLKAINVSVGIAAHPGFSTNVTGFMQSLYAARAAGLRRRRRPVGYYSEQVHERSTRQTTLRHDLPDALSSSEVQFDAQPIFTMPGTVLSGFELLIRWQHPALGRIAPIDFLPIAEELGLMSRIDKLAAKRASALLGDLAAVGLDRVRVGFNLSTDSASSTEFANWLEWHCDAEEIDPARLCIEILETTVFASDLQQDEAAHQIERLRAAGFDIYLDDFGVGFAGLAHLAGLSINGLKIDRSLIDGMSRNKASLVIVESILKLSENLGLEVIAEGIETEEQIATLSAMGCRKVQGFGIERPMPSSVIVDWALERQGTGSRPPHVEIPKSSAV